MRAPAVAEALRRLDVSAVAVATPSVEFVNEAERKYLLARKVDSREAQGLSISCTNFATLPIIALLEREAGKPVVSSVQATAWAVLRALGIRDCVPGYGNLLEEL